MLAPVEAVVEAPVTTEEVPPVVEEPEAPAVVEEVVAEMSDPASAQGEVHFHFHKTGGPVTS